MGAAERCSAALDELGASLTGPAVAAAGPVGTRLQIRMRYRIPFDGFAATGLNWGKSVVAFSSRAAIPFDGEQRSA
ncbi:MAG: hypothetical protein ACI9G1_001440 [Pirellulaceae bacterium]|jgi:hypothetical protein